MKGSENPESNGMAPVNSYRLSLSIFCVDGWSNYNTENHKTSVKVLIEPDPSLGHIVSFEPN